MRLRSNTVVLKLQFNSIEVFESLTRMINCQDVRNAALREIKLPYSVVILEQLVEYQCISHECSTRKFNAFKLDALLQVSVQRSDGHIVSVTAALHYLYILKRYSPAIC